LGLAKAVVFRETIGRCDDDLTQSVDAEQKSKIENNIKESLESQGLIVEFR